MDASRWLVASVITGLTSSVETDCSSIRTIVCDVNLFGRKNVEPSASVTPTIVVSGRTHQYFPRILFTSDMLISPFRIIAYSQLLAFFRQLPVRQFLHSAILASGPFTRSWTPSLSDLAWLQMQAHCHLVQAFCFP